MTMPCHCKAPNADCRRAGLPMVGRLWQLCAGVDCTPETSAAYRRCWDARTDRRHTPCVHLGADTGQRRRCPTCRGHVALKIFACLHSAHAAQPTTTLPDCQLCPHYTESLP